MALFQSLGSVPLFIVMSSRISPETRSGPTDLFFPISPILIIMILISMVNGSPVFSPCLCGILPSLPNTVK